MNRFYFAGAVDVVVQFDFDSNPAVSVEDMLVAQFRLDIELHLASEKTDVELFASILFVMQSYP